MIDFGIVHYMPTPGNPVYIRQMQLQAGYHVDTHIHNFDHFGMLGKGIAEVEIDGKREQVQAPCVIEIKAGKAHRITAIEDITWFCIHATDETDTDKIDKVLIKEN
jgi:quercetin dioxygenase-like cupin family protein